MPSAIKFNQDIILDEAFNIVRHHGLQGLSARKIAQSMGCSTQPVYSSFGSMKALKDAVEKKAYRFFIDYLLQEQLKDDPFLSMGLQYIKFAREEKALFRLYFLGSDMSLTIEKIRSLSAPLLERMKQDASLENLSDEQLDRIGGDMWVYTHGLAALTFRSEDPDIETIVRDKLSRMGDTVIEWEARQATIHHGQNISGDNE